MPPPRATSLRDDDLSPTEQAEVLSLARAMKADRFGYRPLAGPRTVAVLFDKPSLRTRVSFAVGIAELGGLPLVIDAQATHASRGETVADTARVLARQVAAVVWRTFGQDQLAELAAASSVPVINGLTDRFHPCQILADLQTVRERGISLPGPDAGLPRRRVEQHGPPYLLGAPPLGCNADLLGGPTARTDARGRGPLPRGLRRGSVTATADPKGNCADADIPATDVWTSMGQEARRPGDLGHVAVPAERGHARAGRTSAAGYCTARRAPRPGDHRRGPDGPASVSGTRPRTGCTQKALLARLPGQRQ
jgi:ornithine carbamoyltransferase